MAYLTIDFDAYKKNLEFLGRIAGGVEKLFAVLKDNAYGHGIEEMAPLAAAIGIKQVVVKDIKEALKVKPFFQKVLILIEPHPQNSVIDNKLIYSACSIEAMKKFQKNTNIHLKIDTGMRRNGIKPKQIKEAFEIIKEKNLNLEGVFTHFYGADMIGSDYYVQKRMWQEVKTTCKNLNSSFGFKPLIFHSKNSAALLRDCKMDDEFARVGIASYGYTDLDISFGTFPLKPVLNLWAEKISTREINKNEKLGYGGCFKAPKDMIVSTYDVGYGDGFFRTDGKKELILNSGKKILGRLCMDCMSVESKEEKICVFDNVSHIAKHFNTISYEVLSRLSPFLKRVVIHQTSS